MLNPVKKIRRNIRNRKRKKRWKKLTRDIGYIGLDAWNIASHLAAAPDGQSQNAPELAPPQVGFSLVIRQNP